MIFRFRHGLALALLMVGIGLFFASTHFPVFKDAERIAGFGVYDASADYRAASALFKQAVREELGAKLRLEGDAACAVLLALWLWLLPVTRVGGAWVLKVASRRRMFAYGLTLVVGAPVLWADSALRDYDRGLYPHWADSMGIELFYALALGLLLLLLLAPFLISVGRGFGGGRQCRLLAPFSRWQVLALHKLAAAILLLTVLAWAAASLLAGDYVGVALALTLVLFFLNYLYGS
ncbi:hypothetical protein [Pseudomonas rubra]|uniref:Uncharacterized protein n=1 Tax=Pseudomonas rubra TaxID=2942627 RepID=A0ABT5P8A8_9PSED|nr:hypothetical protein [Pseudomonas rubra]MDD1014533.1 hypothetical protein [Pseudomonas rubra]MDD1038761.1 hypothetical protein [Pseudomonas rubra]MDD1156434.1 hypothetical protein [Pseudomonas rubra]